MSTNDEPGSPTDEHKQGTVRIVYSDSSKEPIEFGLTARQVDQLLAWIEKGSSGFVLAPGPRSGLSGKPITAGTGASLSLSYSADEETRKLSLALTDDEVDALTGRSFRARLGFAFTLAVIGTLVSVVLAVTVSEGYVTKHPTVVLAMVTFTTIATATLAWQVVERISSRAVVIASGLGVLLTTLFAIAPNLAPETSTNFTMHTMTIERAVPLKQYLDSPHLRAALRDCPDCSASNLIRVYCETVRGRREGAPARRKDCPPDARRSVVVYVPMESIGFTKKQLPIRWKLVDGATGQAVRPQPVDVLTKLAIEPERRDVDILTIPLWIDLSDVAAKSVFVRVYVSDERGFMIATARSPRFAIRA
jgi:hypothetical protein